MTEKLSVVRRYAIADKVMTATYFGATVVGVEGYTPTSATVFVTMPEAVGVLRIDDAALADIEVSA
ncbi:hypothetical protein [Gordonia sp. NB41Y]|uniref:hypothetical protein n=1 Tax=Gordonia sp. NB41Y TaxID=875808 RepID=UPI0002BF5E81|nr:hypothetical protein [Gordonia sp. NB41Y]EMP10030.1 hypothetical protein ISGA_1474 [Gordonia sp. NB41Y]WLP90223.1 hypothetical protein Q9K23_22360 [Gordonia sp. NB41Y]